MDYVPVYRHVQEGRFIRALLLGIAAVILIPTLILEFSMAGPHFLIGTIVAPILVIVSGMFGSMTIDVTQTDVRWKFALGWPGGRILRSELREATLENPGLLNGIGVHLTMRGWLWNVALGPAVGLRKRDGGEVILGTDDPDGLIAALR